METIFRSSRRRQEEEEASAVPSRITQPNAIQNSLYLKYEEWENTEKFSIKIAKITENERIYAPAAEYEKITLKSREKDVVVDNEPWTYQEMYHPNKQANKFALVEKKGMKKVFQLDT